MRKRTILAFSTLTLVGCSPLTYARKLETGVQATFVGGRLNGPEVSVDTIEAGGSQFTFDYSTFVYMIDGPFQSFQSIASITPEDPSASLRLDPGELAGFASALDAALSDRLASVSSDAACGTPSADASVTPGAVMSECHATHDDVDYHVRIRVLPSTRGLVLQMVSFTNQWKSKAWADTFWSSLALSAAPPPAAGPTESPHFGVGERVARAIAPVAAR